MMRQRRRSKSSLGFRAWMVVVVVVVRVQDAMRECKGTDAPKRDCGGDMYMDADRAGRLGSSSEDVIGAVNRMKTIKYAGID